MLLPGHDRQTTNLPKHPLLFLSRKWLFKNNRYRESTFIVWLLSVPDLQWKGTRHEAFYYCRGCFGTRVLLYSLRWSEIGYINEAGLKFVRNPLPLEYWDYSLALPHPVSNKLDALKTQVGKVNSQRGKLEKALKCFQHWTAVGRGIFQTARVVTWAEVEETGDISLFLETEGCGGAVRNATGTVGRPKLWKRIQRRTSSL